MAPSDRERLGELLRRIGLVTDEQLDDALTQQSIAGGRLGEILVRELVLSEDQLATALAEQKNLRLVNLAGIEIDRNAASLLPIGMARMREVIPIGFHDGKLVLAMSDPLDIEAIDETQLRTGHRVEAVVASASQVRFAIDKYLVASNALEELGRRSFGASAEALAEDMVEGDVPVVRIVNQMLRGAVRDGASDVHIEPCEHETRVRYRIDGVLQDIAGLPKASHMAVAARLKVLADMDITERRRPLDGRVALRVDGIQVDVRVTTYPTRHGEGLVLRLLRADESVRAIDEIGLLPSSRAAVDRILAKPHGALLVSGPTGSGKTTTVYSIIQMLNSPERKLITIEDPIEYQVHGITQIAVNSKFGLTFAAGLRTILRADPDIVVVGEIRDPETATIGVRAALTGHLVLSTLHANDAPATLTRLAELGVEPYLSSSAVLGVIAQRLVRRLCTKCRKAHDIEIGALVELGFTTEQAYKVRPYEAVGCDACRQSGYRGRIGVYEVMEMNAELMRLRLEHAPAERLRECAIASGMRTMRQDGLEKVAAGITSISEVLRVAV
jgi:type IV pilus assembly protein PilB